MIAGSWKDLDEQQRGERRRAAEEDGKKNRDILKARLLAEGAPDLAAKLEICGQQLRLVCTCCGSKKNAEAHCRRRWCPACAYIVQRDRVGKFAAATTTMQWPLAIMLSIPSTTDPEAIRDLRKSWSKMRRRKLIESKISGGISTVEVTEGDHGWHPHLHILADCRWLAVHVPEPNRRDTKAIREQKCEMAQRELSAIWGSVIGLNDGPGPDRSAYVWVNRKKPGEALAYAMKYALKGSTLAASTLPIAPLIRVLSKSRMISAFGDLHGRVEEDDEEEKPGVQCPDCGNEKSFMPAEVVDMQIRSISRQIYDREHKIGERA